MTKEPTAVEIDGVTWRPGDLGMTADGTIVQLDGPWGDDWNWGRFGNDEIWVTGSLARPIRKMKLVPADPEPAPVCVQTGWGRVAHDGTEETGGDGLPGGRGG